MKIHRKSSLPPTKLSLRRLRWLLSMILMGLFVGLCFNQLDAQTDQLDSKYGRARGRGFSKSVNGTSVFAEMFRDSGRRVQFDSRLSPRLDKFETIVWFPDRFEPPSEEVIARFEQWLGDGYGRTVIFVERDFDAELIYWQQALAQAAPADRTKIRRRITLLENAYKQRRQSGTDLARNQCSWYRIDSRLPLPPQKCQSFGGTWAGWINTNQADIYLGSNLTVPPSAAYDSEVLLSSNGQPLITVLSSWQYNDESIIIVNNGSSLINLQLVNSENRKIATELIDLCSPDGDVLFLESGEIEPVISNSTSTDTASIWEWAQEEPLCYMIPHLIWLGLVFCFVYFPIFGRSKIIRSQANTDFANHIQATARLLAHSSDRHIAQQKIDHANQVIGRQETN